MGKNITMLEYLSAEKADFKKEKKIIIRDIGGCYIMIKVSIIKEKITFSNMHADSNRRSKYIGQRFLEQQR